jgi:hypothetical protein
MGARINQSSGMVMMDNVMSLAYDEGLVMQVFFHTPPSSGVYQTLIGFYDSVSSLSCHLVWKLL